MRRYIQINAHLSLYEKMEELRKLYRDQAGVSLSQVELTNMISKKIKIPNKINILRAKNVKKKKGRPY